jgi:hypothetical protein
MAALQGLPDYPFVVIAHPIASASDDELRGKAEEALGRIVEVITDRRREPDRTA